MATETEDDTTAMEPKNHCDDDEQMMSMTRGAEVAVRSRRQGVKSLELRRRSSVRERRSDSDDRLAGDDGRSLGSDGGGVKMDGSPMTQLREGAAVAIRPSIGCRSFSASSCTAATLSNSSGLVASSKLSRCQYLYPTAAVSGSAWTGLLSMTLQSVIWDPKEIDNGMCDEGKGIQGLGQMRILETWRLFPLLCLLRIYQMMSRRRNCYWFKWSGWINDIYLLRKEKEGKNCCYAFIRYTTKGGALKAITDMNNMNLRGNKISVKKAYCRRDNKGMTVSKNGPHEVGNAGSGNVGVKLVKSFLSYKENQSVCATKQMTHEILSDASSDYQYFIARGNVEMDERGDLLQLQHMEMMRDKRSEDAQHEGEVFFKSNTGRPSDLEETINQIWKVHCQGGKIKKKKLITRKISGNQKQKTKNVSRHKVTKEVERLGNEVGNDGEEVLDKNKENNDTSKVVQIKEFEKTKTRDVRASNDDFETGGYENGEDLMSILKEQNEAIALKRRKAKQKEKARKSRPKRTKPD
ncbi:hypothetical protein PIB30_045702 [Stylosanthes scabra]|uniref:RRM domain-containing protein n=1 Tax=Stylosanthes scabra TaxID=79078 RepID=A0ABU6UJ00_9FABA|nr:hypothetical protein [Stylosanthes scabra]